MITEDLFDTVLLEPAKSASATKLYIVSGYATAAMSFHHLDTLRRIGKPIQLKLIVGMCSQDGLSLSNHRAFQHLSNSSDSDFQCSYVIRRPPVHSKVYAWLSDENTPLFGFAGSSNYTQTAFGPAQRETVAKCDAEEAFEYFQRIARDTIYCTHAEAENFVQIYNDKYYARLKKDALFQDQSITHTPELHGLPSVRLSFLDKSAKLPTRSGLNWGQRPEEGREPNQAYIKLPSSVYKTEFFPPVAVHFTVLTDDDKVLICTRAQQNGKAIHTPHNNSLIGEYFRNRLDVPSGYPVTNEALLQYGRTDIDVYKIDDETYFMDFSVSSPRHG